MRPSHFLPALALLVVPAFADQYLLTVDSCTGGCSPNPYGTVDVVQNGTNTVRVTITLNGGNLFVLTGNRPTVGFDLVGNPTVAISNLTAGFSLVSTTAGNVSQMNGVFGTFDYGINCCSGKKGGANAQAGPLVFDLTAAGLTPTSFRELSTGGNTPSYFAVDILAANGNTGVVGANGTPTTGAVPEPTSVVLLSTVALTFGYLLRRRQTA